MFELKTSASFDSAHFLSGYQGKCSNLHGHRWKIEVTVGQEALQEEGNYRGMVIDFGDVKHAVKALADSYDHAMIYEEGTLQRATVEALLAEEQFAKCFYEKLTADGLPVRRVAVYETPENCAVYEV